jgi:uncharacterized protein YjbJ (UPF0337 family)
MTIAAESVVAMPRRPRFAGTNIKWKKEAQTMNWNQIEGQWKQVKGKAKAKWGKLTDDEIDVIEGKRDQLVGKIQQRYGIAKDQAEREVDDWMKEF